MPVAHYFAFGANMDSSVLGRRGIAPLFSEAASLPGFSLDFRQRGMRYVEPCFASVHEDAGQEVHGVLYGLAPSDMARLDAYEAPGYDKCTVRVRAAARGEVEASIYVAREEVRGRHPSPRYVGLLVAGAEQHGLPDAYVARLRAWPTTRPPRFVPPMRYLIGAIERLQRLHPSADRAVKRLYRYLG